MPRMTFLEFLSRGEYLPAVGIALAVIVAAARNGLGAIWPWWKGQVGGYILGFGSAALLYLGAALEAGQVPTLGLAMAALAAGWVSSGAWEGFRDAIHALQKKPPTSGPVLLVLIVAIGLGCSTGCPGGSGSGSGPIATIIDCTAQDQGKLINLGLELAPLMSGGSPDWSTIESKAITAGASIGGCVVAELVQKFLGGRKAVPVDDSWKAYQALERMRALAGGAVFRTKSGDL